MHFFGLDTETTGLSAKDDRVIDLGIVEVDDGKEGFEYSRQFNPGRSIPPEATKVHGYTYAMVADKPPIKSELMGVLAMLTGQVLVGHNLTYDLDMLDAECERNHLPTLRSVIAGSHDTYKIAKATWPGKACDLNAVCRKLKISLADRKLHGALVDARLSARCFIGLSQSQNAMFVDVDAGPVVHAPSAENLALRLTLPVIRANAAELTSHATYLTRLEAETKAVSVWHRGPTPDTSAPISATVVAAAAVAIEAAFDRDEPPADYDGARLDQSEDPSVGAEDFETLEAMTP